MGPKFQGLTGWEQAKNQSREFWRKEEKTYFTVYHKMQRLQRHRSENKVGSSQFHQFTSVIVPSTLLLGHLNRNVPMSCEINWWLERPVPFVLRSSVYLSKHITGHGISGSNDKRYRKSRCKCLRVSYNCIWHLPHVSSCHLLDLQCRTRWPLQLYTRKTERGIEKDEWGVHSVILWKIWYVNTWVYESISNNPQTCTGSACITLKQPVWLNSSSSCHYKSTQQIAAVLYSCSEPHIFESLRNAYIRNKNS